MTHIDQLNRTLTNAKVAKVSHQPITLNVTLNHALAGVIGSHGQNVQMHVAKMSALENETISANTFPLQRAKALVTIMTHTWTEFQIFLKNP